MTETTSFQTINVGSTPNDRTGDNLRNAFIKVNSNFANITNIGADVGNLKVSGFANIAGNLNIIGAINVIGNVNYANVTSSITNYTTLSITGTTQSTSTTTGALVVSGGVGIAKDVYIGGNVNINHVAAAGVVWGNTGLGGTLITAAQPNVTSLGVISTLNVSGVLRASGIFYANSAGAATSHTTGGAIIAGGLGVGGNLFLNGGLGAGGVIGNNGQLLASTGTGVTWTNPPIGNSLLSGTSIVSVVTNYVNVSIGGSNVVSFSANGILANVTGTILTASQTNITSVGNLSALAASGTIQTTGRVYGNSGIGGTLLTAAQPNVTSVGNLSALAASGTIQTTGIVYGNSGVSGTLLTAAQPNVTSVGNLSSLSSSGTIQTTGNVIATNFVGNGALLTGLVTSDLVYGNTQVATYLPVYTGNIGGNLTTAAQSKITSVGTLTSLTVSGNITINSSNNATAIVNGGTAGAGNIGASGAGFDTVFAKATTAQYADLAEKYLADVNYEPGTVVMVGGVKEVTASQFGYRAIGVVSTNPAYMMNSELDGGTYIALKGRVPVNVIGTVNKGDRLVASNNGVAQSLNKVIPSDLVFAIALENNNDGAIDTIEAIIL
jgi:hypothetical protein